jgi:hypothetical protein
MADKSPKKPPSRKAGQTLKEKRAAKRAKRDDAPNASLPVTRARRG